MNVRICQIVVLLIGIFPSYGYGRVISGILFGEKEITIKSKSQGELTVLNLGEGERVGTGTVIAIVDDRQEKIELEQAKLEYQSALHDYEKTEKIKKFISKDEIRQKKDWAALKKTNLDLKEYHFSNTQIVSPIDGIISKKYFDQGETVSTGDKVFEVVQLDRLVIEMNVPSELADQIKKGDKLQFNTDKNRDRKLESEVSYISPIVDAASGTIKVRLSVKNSQNPDHTYVLRPGMLTLVEILKGDLQGDPTQGPTHQ